MPDRRPNPLHPPPNLLSLPKELLTQIALHLDRPSALSLARVCRSLTSSAEHRIWRDIDLFLPDHYGEHPLVQPYARSGSGQYCAWAKAEAKLAEDRHRLGLKEKVKTIMNRADERKWGLVEKVTVVPRTGAIFGIIQLLDFVSPNLKELLIDGPADHVFADHWKPNLHETLEYKLLDCGIKLPQLTHLREREGGFRYEFAIPALLQAAPNLTSIDVDFSPYEEYYLDEDREGVVPVPSLPDRPHIRKMRLDADCWSAETSKGLALELLGCSPQLDTLLLSSQFHTDCSVNDLTDVLNSLRDLTSFACNEVLRSVNEWDLSSPKLKRLIAMSDGWTDMFDSLPASASLEALYLAGHIREFAPSGESNYPEPVSTCRMTHHMAVHLRSSPFLGTISFLRSGTDPTAYDAFDKLAEKVSDNNPRMIIRSLRYSGEELIHARIWNCYVEIQDIRSVPGAYATGSAEEVIEYTAGGGGNRIKRFEKRDSACWQDYTDFDGHMVPLDIIKKMGQVEGAKTGDWEGRGVEVGAEAWKVLTDWRDDKVAKEKASKSKMTGKKGDEASKANTSAASAAATVDP